MSNKIKDLTGQRFGSLTVVEYSPRKTKHCLNSHWICRCDCSQLVIVRSDNLRTGRTTQCGECRSAGGRRSVYVKDVIVDE